MAEAFNDDEISENCESGERLHPLQSSNAQGQNGRYMGTLSGVVMEHVVSEPQQVRSSAFKGSTDEALCFHSSSEEGSVPQDGKAGSCQSPGDKVIRPSSPLGKCHINSLPYELLLYIFSFLSVYELCKSVAPVCTAWRDLSKDPSFWTHLAFCHPHRIVEKERMQRLLEGSPLLVSLELEGCEDCGVLLHQVASTCIKLRELTVKFCNGMTETILKLLIKSCPNIQYLNVEGSCVDSTESYYAIAGLHQLRHLNLSHCSALDSGGLTTIAKQCKQLEYLDIDGITNIYDYAVVSLTKELSHCLKTLLIDGEYLTDAAYQSLRACTKLEKLWVSFCELMTDAGLSGISGLKNLTSLKLRKGSQLTPKGLSSLFSDGVMSLLAYVNLSECVLMDDSVLSAISLTCPQLDHLALHWCWELTDTGISFIIAACPRLRVLDLEGVVQLTGTAFSNLPSALPDLLILDLQQCNCVDDTILKRLVAQKPSLVVLSYWGDPVSHSDTDSDSDS